MTRQVNLAKNELLPGFGKVQLPMFVVGFLIALTLASLWVFYAWNEYHQLLQREAMATQIAQSHLTALTQFQQQNPNLGNEQRLTEKNTLLSSQLESAREAYSGLSNQVENAIDGFNESLQQLSDYDLDGLWLNSILLKDGKRLFSIEGFAQAPELIPNYLNALGESTFHGITVEQLSVSKEENKNQLWRFTMSNDRSLAAQGTQNAK